MLYPDLFDSRRTRFRANYAGPSSAPLDSPAPGDVHGVPIDQAERLAKRIPAGSELQRVACRECGRRCIHCDVRRQEIRLQASVLGRQRIGGETANEGVLECFDLELRGGDRVSTTWRLTRQARHLV